MSSRGDGGPRIDFDVDIVAVAQAMKKTGERLGHLTTALKSGAKIVQDEWKSRVAVGAKGRGGSTRTVRGKTVTRRTGNLRSRGSAVKGSSTLGNRYGGPYAMVYVHTGRVPYAGVQERGGSVMWKGAKKPGGKVWEYPIFIKPHTGANQSYYLFPAFDAREADVYDQVDEAVSKLVKEMF
jgi:hypothetical protein